jgi:hypothetical protein
MRRAAFAAAVAASWHNDNQLARVRWDRFAREDDDKRSPVRRRLKLVKPSIDLSFHSIPLPSA